jgi:predicted Zn-dependent protease
MLMSESQEIALGLQSDPGIIANFGLYPDSTLQQFINVKGKEMAAISHRPNLDYQFRVLDSPVVNAFAVPGGFVYFTRGILAHFNNEAEFAGVLGHEIGHISGRHSAKQYTKATLGQLGFVMGMIVSEDFRKFSDLAYQGMSLLFLKFGRDDESQSDMLGVEYSSKIGYDSHEMANFFGVLSRMQEKSGQSIPTFMSTHPDPGDRFQKVHQMTEEWQSSNPPQNYAVNRESYLRMIDGLTYGEDPRQGYVENWIFYHPELKFLFPVPAGWRVVNTPSMVQMAPEDGKAIILLTLAAEKGLEEAAQATVEKDQLQVVESARTSVNGFPAIAMISEQAPQTDPNTGAQQNPADALRILTYLIQDGELIYKFHGLSRKGDFNSYFNQFSATMKNFDRLTDPAKINVKPERIQVVSVRNSGTLEDAFSAYQVPQDRMEEIAILNNMQLTDQISGGELIKILRK